MNGFNSKIFSRLLFGLSLKTTVLLSIAASLAIPVVALAQPYGPYWQPQYAGGEAGDWGGKKGAVIGPADGTCANMGAEGKVNEVNNFGFTLPGNATILGLQAFAKAGAAAGQEVAVQVCTNTADLNTCSEPPVVVTAAEGGQGNCAQTIVNELPYVLPITDDNFSGTLTQTQVQLDTFGLVLVKIQKSEVKVDSICLQVQYETDEGVQTSLECFEEAPDGTLTLQKTLDANGGSAVVGDWTLTAQGNEATGNTLIQGASGISGNAPAGTYVLSESTVTGYQLVTDGITCLINGEGSFSSPNLTLGEGSSAVCGFENEGIRPELTVIKHVVSDFGGSAVAGDWTMDVTATDPSDASFPGAESPGTTITLDAGAYSVDESGGPGGYTKSLGANCSGTLALAASATCTITNTQNEPPPPPPPPAEVPTLSQWALILLAMLVLGFGLYSRREQRSRH